MRFYDIRILPFGASRREALVKYLLTPDERGKLPTIGINRAHQLQLRYDPDLRYMLKKGILKRGRDGMRSCRNTFLYLAKP